MVDVVVNHFAWAGDPWSIQYDKLIPFNNSSCYHGYCDVMAPNTSSTALTQVSDDYRQES